MKYSFYMNADNYCDAFRYKLKKTKRDNKIVLYSILIAAVMILLSILFEGAQMLYIGAVIMIFSGVLVNSVNKKSIKAQFLSSPALTSVHTLTIFDEGLEIINSYEKMFVPWQSIYDIKNDTDKITIIPTYRKGLVVIDKINADRDELNAFLSVLLSHTGKEGR